MILLGLTDEPLRLKPDQAKNVAELCNTFWESQA